jgi:hypothetical protein
MDYYLIWAKNFPSNKIWAPPLLEQKGLWGEHHYLPIPAPQDMLMQRQLFNPVKESSKLNKKKKSFLGCNLIPRDWKIEGKEELPCLLPYTGPFPQDVVGIDERIPKISINYAVDGFCYDHILMQKTRNFENAVSKAKKFLCAFGWNFSVPLDAKKCEALEAIRLNRYTTLGLQLRGVPTIQCHSLCNARFYDFAHDGLAPNCPVVIGNRLTLRDQDLLYLQQMGIEELIRRKSPTVLIVVGNRLAFDPGIPVVYYKSRIQKLRDHDYR